MLLATDKVVAIVDVLDVTPPAAASRCANALVLTKVGEVDDTVLEERVRMGTLIEETAIVDMVCMIVVYYVQGVRESKGRRETRHKAMHRKKVENPDRQRERERGRKGVCCDEKRVQEPKRNVEQMANGMCERKRESERRKERGKMKKSEYEKNEGVCWLAMCGWGVDYSAARVAVLSRSR